MILQQDEKRIRSWRMLGGTHMHKAWHYLLHAEFHEAKVDYRDRSPKTGVYTMSLFHPG